MADYTGICIARFSTIQHYGGDVAKPEQYEIHGVSQTMPMPCEKFVAGDMVFEDVFIPPVGWVSMPDNEFNRQFIVVNGWEAANQN